MRESDIERSLRNKIIKLGGRAYKFISPGNNGMPDRLILIKGKVFFVETKAPGKKLKPLQRQRKRELEAQGFTVFTVDSPKTLDETLVEINRAVGGDPPRG